MTARTSRARSAPGQRRAFGRLSWLLWPGLVALIVLGLRPSFCLLQEAGTNGGHSHSHHAAGSQHHSGTAHRGHDHDAPDSQSCCGDDEPVVLALASSQQGPALAPAPSAGSSLLAALPPAPHPTVTLASWRGRDGPPQATLLCLLSPLRLAGRSPPSFAVAL